MDYLNLNSEKREHFGYNSLDWEQKICISPNFFCVAPIDINDHFWIFSFLLQYFCLLWQRQDYTQDYTRDSLTRQAGHNTMDNITMASSQGLTHLGGHFIKSEAQSVPSLSGSRPRHMTALFSSNEIPHIIIWNNTFHSLIFLLEQLSRTQRFSLHHHFLFWKERKRSWVPLHHVISIYYNPLKGTLLNFRKICCYIKVLRRLFLVIMK